ncbi:hypothetical protein D9757_011463 [Collybiopsis confluens]|uniref:Uncharacterized protein n=1 Tax=Collybiopsis confluens TaxID=2823264 RepID=A0A8H5LR48_9AGAR|nr:hypothetical protein D9757_011463 [Collybiopsis confluens]
MNAAIYTSIFWPSQCQESGYVFGWINTHSQNRTIVVAGVLPASVPQHLQQLQNDNHISTLGSLKVLGKCSIRPHKRKWRRRRRAPVLVLDEMEEIGPFRESDIVFYHRHQPNTQRFYSMNAPDELSSSRKSGSGINQKVIDQVPPLPSLRFRNSNQKSFRSSIWLEPSTPQSNTDNLFNHLHPIRIKETAR